MTTRKKPTETATRGAASRSAKAPSAADSRKAMAPKAEATEKEPKSAAAKRTKAASDSAAPAPKASKKSSAEAEAEPKAVEAEAVAEVAAAAPEQSEAVTALLADPSAPSLVGQEAERLIDPRPAVANQAAATIAGVFAVRPELVVPHVGKLAKAIVTKNKKVVAVCADAMPAIAKVAPARVARELDFLRTNFRASLEDGQDGLVRTFATLCIASVAYQKRLEPILTEALAIAEGKTLLRWAQTILPSLKGEPHARARAVVEGRLDSLPRPVAQPIADFLGIKLRALPPRR